MSVREESFRGLVQLAPALALICACIAPQRRLAETDRSAPFPLTAPVTADTGLVLEAHAERSTISGRDPLWLTYRVRNRGPAPRRFENAELSWRITVLGPSGKPVEERDWAEATLASTELTIPVGGFVGQEVNLRCAGNWWAKPPAFSRSGSPEGCAAEFMFADPGEYRIVVQYRSGGDTTGGLGPLRLTSDTVRVTYRR